MPDEKCKLCLREGCTAQEWAHYQSSKFNRIWRVLPNDSILLIADFVRNTFPNVRNYTYGEVSDILYDFGRQHGLGINHLHGAYLELCVNFSL